MDRHANGDTRLDLARAVHGTLRRMHHITRYSSIPIIKPEHVSTHSWQMAMMALMICHDIEADVETRSEAVDRCIVHDISECISGDIIRTYKHGSKEMQKACETADVRNTYALTREFGSRVGDAVFVTWSNAKDSSLAGDIVRFCDAVCVVTYCAEELRMGNAHMADVPRDIYEEVLAPMADHPQLGRYVKQLFPDGEYSLVTDNRWVRTWKSPAA